MNKKCTPGKCSCAKERENGPSLHHADWTPHLEAMMKVLPAERPFHKALVLVHKQLRRVRAATGKAIEQNTRAARVIPRFLRPLEIGELDPVMLAVGLGIASLAAPLEALLDHPLLALPLGIAEGRTTQMGKPPGPHLLRLQAMREDADVRSIFGFPAEVVGTLIKDEPAETPLDDLLFSPSEETVKPLRPDQCDAKPEDLIREWEPVPPPEISKEEQAKRDQAAHEAIIQNARVSEADHAASEAKKEQAKRASPAEIIPNDREEAIRGFQLLGDAAYYAARGLARAMKAHKVYQDVRIEESRDALQELAGRCLQHKADIHDGKMTVAEAKPRFDKFFEGFKALTRVYDSLIEDDEEPQSATSAPEGTQAAAANEPGAEVKLDRAEPSLDDLGDSDGPQAAGPAPRQRRAVSPLS